MNPHDSRAFQIHFSYEFATLGSGKGKETPTTHHIYPPFFPDITVTTSPLYDLFTDGTIPGTYIQKDFSVAYTAAYHGTDPQFSWDFGDGTAAQNGITVRYSLL